MRATYFTSLLLIVGLILSLTVLAYCGEIENAENHLLPDSFLEGLVETKIDERLTQFLGSPELVTVIIYLREQPQFAISNEVKELLEPNLRQVSERIGAIHAKYRRTPLTNSVEEERLLARLEMTAITPADQDRISSLHLEAREIKDRINEEITIRSDAAIAPSQNALINAVEEIGGKIIYRYSITNSIAARLPGTAIPGISRLPFVAFVIADTKSEIELDVSVPSISAATFWNAGSSGGVWRSATLDSGVTTNHPSLSGHTWTSRTFHEAGGDDSWYNDDANTTNDLQGHGTHVAGIMDSTHATTRGVSFGSVRSMNLKAGWRATDGRAYMYESDCRAAIDWALKHSVFPDVINYSIGATNPDDYCMHARFFDAAITRGSGTTITKSAGNRGTGTNRLSGPLAYNFLQVANVDDQGTVDRSDDEIWISSSRGPTPSGRKKPDIAAPGRSIMSANFDWEDEDNFVEKTGTSMSAPHVAGAAVLLHDVGVYDPRAIKAILLNTAEDRGDPGWNEDWGWGYIDLEHAYFHRNDYFLHSVYPRDNPGSYRFYKSTGMGMGDSATLVWNRRVDYNDDDEPTTWYTLSDLNMRLYDEATGALIDSSLSGRDNVEQVVTNRNTTHVIKVYAWSTSFSGVTSETYALATENNTWLSTGPSLSCLPEEPNYSPPVGAKFLVRARVRNTGGVGAHNSQITINVPAGMTLVSGASTQNVGTAASGGGNSSYASWWVRADTLGTKTVNFSVNSNSYAETWEASGSALIYPGVADNVPPTTVMSIGEPNYLIPGTEQVSNGGFEKELFGWTTDGNVSITSDAYSGSSAARIVGTQTGTSYIRQDLTVPGIRPILLSLWYKTARSGLLSPSRQLIQIRNQSDGRVLATLVNQDSTHGWKNIVFDLTTFMGKNVYLYACVTAVGTTTSSSMIIDDISITSGGKVWVRSSTEMNLLCTDDRAGVDYSEYMINLHAWIQGTTFSLTNPGEQWVDYRSVDNSGNVESDVCLIMGLDDTPPTTPVVDAPGHTVSKTALSASWSASDPDSGISSYRYAIGTSPGSSNIVGWVTTSATAVTRTGLSLNAGQTYYWTVMALNGAGMWSSAGSADTTVVLETQTIADARNLPDGSPVQVADKIVTAVFGDSFYIQEADRSCGIRVVWSGTQPNEGDLAGLMGEIGTSFAEREIVASSVSISSVAGMPRPLGMANRNLAGQRFNDYEQQVPGAVGTNNVGLLVNTWGEVTRVWAGSFYIDDGSRIGTYGLLVNTNAIGVTPPKVGQYVTVTGISGVNTAGGVPIRVLKPRRAEDIVLKSSDAAFVYDSLPGDAQSFKSLLDGQGVTTDLVAYSAIGATDWSKYHVIIIGRDTGTWSDPTLVNTIVGTQTPIIAIGAGGARFLNAVSAPDLFIGWTQSMVTSSITSGRVFAGDIYTYPHDLGVLPGDTLQLFSSNTGAVMLHDPNGVSDRFLQNPANLNYATLAGEAGRFYQWGYSGSPTLMTQTGKHLFVNLVYSTVLP